MEVVKSRLLLSLDDLLDTRAGVLCDLNPKLVAELLLDPAYAERIIDVFKGFNKDDFDKRYKERDKKVLSLSTSTKVGVIIFDFVQRVVNRNLESPFNMDPVVHINMYPYNLSDKEQSYIKAAVLTKLPLKPQIEFVNLSLEQITPQLLKENYKTAIMYHFWDWIEVQSKNENIKKCPLPDFTIFAPMLLKHVDNQLPEDIAGKFADIITYFRLHLGLVFLPMDNFSSFLAVRRPPTPEGEQPVNLEGEVIDHDY